jgi:hypothetical protein
MRVTTSGQVSLPAEIRRRWNVSRVRLVDHGDHVTLEPIPDDVFAATIGMFADPAGPSSDEIQAAERIAGAKREERQLAGLRRLPAGRRPTR